MLCNKKTGLLARALRLRWSCTIQCPLPYRTFVLSIPYLMLCFFLNATAFRAFQLQVLIPLASRNSTSLGRLTYLLAAGGHRSISPIHFALNTHHGLPSNACLGDGDNTKASYCFHSYCEFRLSHGPV